MHKPMGKIGFALIIVISLFTMVGCSTAGQDGSKERPSAGGSAGSNQTAGFQETLDEKRQVIQAEDQAKAVDVSGTKVDRNKVGTPATGTAGGRTGATPDLIIKSNNQVSGSNQQVIDELQKATDELIKSIDSMENVDTAELDF